MRTQELATVLGSAGLLFATALGGGWSAKLSPQGDSKVGGSASIEASGGGGSQTGQAAAYQASISVTGGTAGGSLGWTVQEGSCSSPGSAVGSASAYPAIKVDEGGTGNATATIASQLDASKAYSVSVNDGGTVLACGDFTAAQ